MYLGQAQHIANRHSVSRTGSAYQGQAQRIEDNHIVLRKSTAYRGQAQSIRDRRGGLKTKNPIIPCPRDKTWPPYTWVQSECFVKREDICLNTFQLLFKINLKPKKYLICFHSRYCSCWHIMSGFLVVSIPSHFDTSRFGTNWSRFDMTSLGLQPKP